MEKLTASSIYAQMDSGESEDMEDTLNEIANFISRVMTERDLKSIAKETLKTVAHLFKMDDMLFVLWDDNIQRFKVLAALGYPPDVEKMLLETEYTVDWLSYEIPKKYLIDQDILYLQAEEIWELEKQEKPDPIIWDMIQDEEGLQIDHPEDAYEARQSLDQWHELDFFMFVIRNSDGKPIGYFEINDSADEKLPSRDRLLLINTLATIAGTAIESARIRENQQKIMDRMKGITSIITEDLDRTLKDSMRNLNIVQRPGVEGVVFKQSIENLITASRESLELIHKMSRIREIEAKASRFVDSDPILYLRRSVDKIKKANPQLDIEINSDEKMLYLKTDPYLEDLFTSCFETILSMKDGGIERIAIDVSKKHVYHGVDEIDICFKSPDIDLTSWRRLSFELSTIDPRSGRTKFSGGHFSKFLMVFISRRYGGKVWSEELRDPNSEYKGALHIDLPIYN